MTVLLPAWLQNGSYSAEIDRFVGTALTAQSTSLGARGGVRRVAGTEFQITATGPASMSLQVGAGTAWVQGGYTATQGVYTVVNDSVFTVALTAADPTNPRIDLVILQVLDQSYSGASNLAQVISVPGVAAATPTPPVPTGNFITLAQVLVPAAATTIGAAGITDLRPFGGPMNTPLPVRNLAERNALPNKYDGLRVFMMDNAWEVHTYYSGQWYGSDVRYLGVTTFSTHTGILNDTAVTVIDRAKVPDPGFVYMLHLDFDMEVSGARVNATVYSEPTTTTSFATVAAAGQSLMRESISTRSDRLRINRTFPATYTGNRWVTVRFAREPAEPDTNAWASTSWQFACQLVLRPVRPAGFTASALTGGAP